jgi:hypothetical protein
MPQKLKEEMKKMESSIFASNYSKSKLETWFLALLLENEITFTYHIKNNHT